MHFDLNMNAANQCNDLAMCVTSVNKDNMSRQTNSYATASIPFGLSRFAAFNCISTYVMYIHTFHVTFFFFARLLTLKWIHRFRHIILPCR